MIYINVSNNVFQVDRRISLRSWGERRNVVCQLGSIPGANSKIHDMYVSFIVLRLTKTSLTLINRTDYISSPNVN